MGGLTRKKLWSIMALGTMIGLLLLPIVISLPALAGGAGAPAAGGPPPDVAKAADAAAGKDAGPKVEKGRDVYYKTEGIVSGAPAPKTADNAQFYPRYNFESRVLLWFANQQHLYYGSFVLAVPIFCMIIEFMGVVSKDRAMAKKYDQLAYDFIKISLTAYSLTAILGGILIFTFLTLYPAFFGYLSSIFRPVMHVYALMFVAVGGGVVAAYAAYRFLAAKTDEERAHYDWMGYIAMAIGVAFLIPLPFAGYWLMREVYAYRQQMGITLMGGLLAWLFIIQATMI